MGIILLRQAERAPAAQVFFFFSEPGGGVGARRLRKFFRALRAISAARARSSAREWCDAPFSSAARRGPSSRAPIPSDTAKLGRQSVKIHRRTRQLESCLVVPEGMQRDTQLIPS